MHKKAHYLNQLEINAYVPRAQARPEQNPPVAGAPQESSMASADWAQLESQVASCQRCSLCQTRKNTVFGVGNRQAELMLIGEAPGATEDARGEPFVGEAGQLLDKMLAAIGLSRDQVFIANILKCRPPQNRDPLASEVAECMPYWLQQIAWIQPKLILALGRVAAQNLLGVTTALGRLRGETYTFGLDNVPLMVTYHPAYLLRTPTDKRLAWEDLQRAQAFLKNTPSNVFKMVGQVNIDENYDYKKLRRGE